MTATINEKPMIKCPLCENQFIPRTFYPEDAIFSTPDQKKFSSGFNGYLAMGSIKPPEVILGTWVTYCPKCNYIMKFVKEIVRKEKVQTHNMKSIELAEKYNNYYFGFEYGDYSQYLREITERVSNEIEETLNDINMDNWENLYAIKDNFKFLVRFFTNLDNYCNKTLNLTKVYDMPNKIRKLNLPKEVELILLQLNNIKNQIVQGDYELSLEEEDMINGILVKFVFFLINSHIKPLVNEHQLENGYEFIRLSDLQAEIKIFLANYLYTTFNSDPKSSRQIKGFLDRVFEIQIS
jgi:hypothetical protein